MPVLTATDRALPPVVPQPTTRPPLRGERLTPRDHRLWDAFVSRHPQGSFFHTTAWNESVAAAFGHQVIYLAARRGDHLAGILPLACVRSLLAGTMLVSVPYAIYGGVLAEDDRAPAALLAAARDEARSLGARCIDLRSQKPAFADLPRIDRYVTFRRNLPDAPGDVLAWLPRKARAAARSARDKHGLTVRFDDRQLPQVWRLYAHSMRRLASLNYPYRFFQELIARSPSSHLVSIVYDGQRPLAGLVSFIFGDTVLPYFVGSTDAAHRLNAFNFIYLTLAERAVEMNLRVFDFGRSRIDNPGCVNFKRFQGFEPTPLGYQCDLLPGHHAPDLTPDNPKFGLARRVWPRLPEVLTRSLGAWLSRHVPG
ncbi:MAG TPA: FemAB family XrtA/PEP-CTERM system-associated protein [Phycisphaerae bacterium]|nr:FemAB family XrtA/PEP-CTERM system-associated protein [Phycisphaerae bacterium]